MTRTGERDLSRIGWTDYLLMTLGSCLAAFSGGMAIQIPAVGAFSVIAIFLGAICSFAVRAIFLQSPVLKWDGYLYAAGIVAAFAFGSRLQVLMPEGGYPVDVMAAGWLAWMLIFGSFFTWQDNTLLFQAIPSVAMLGLVGVYDTFKDIRYFFFAYLLCLATLFARAHRRAMLRQAADSGYFTRGLAPGTPTPSVETTPGLAQRMEEGPWRWIAGPGWALASAFVVVLISLLGTPVIRQSVKSVSGFVQVPIPRTLRQKITPPATMPQTNGGNVQVGQGPNQLTHDPVFEAELDRARYLRVQWYDLYSQGRWSNSTWFSPPMVSPDEIVTRYELEVIKDPVRVPYGIRARRPLKALPVPGIVVGWANNQRPGNETSDGRIELGGGTLGDQVFRGTMAVAGEGRPVQANLDLPPVYGHMLDAESASTALRDLTQRVTAKETTDIGKANAIRDTIAQTITYNLDAPATPSGQDPVDYVMFTQKQAYCDVYASTMTLMARAAGIPARYVVGYLPDESERDANGTYVVLDSDLHAWSELYFKDFGWVIFDATEGAAAVPGQERGAANDNGPIWQQPWFGRALNGAIGVLLVCAAYFIARPFVTRMRNRTPKSELDEAYIAFARALERAAQKRRDPSRTPDEFLREVSGSLGSALPMAQALNARFVNLMYSPKGPSESDIAQLRSELRDLRQALKRERSG